MEHAAHRGGRSPTLGAVPGLALTQVQQVTFINAVGTTDWGLLGEEGTDWEGLS